MAGRAHVPYGEKFQSTLSVRRATPSPPKMLPNAVLFQSTLSVRRATDKWAIVKGNALISIHALRKESDAGNGRLFRLLLHFNPRSP